MFISHAVYDILLQQSKWNKIIFFDAGAFNFMRSNIFMFCSLLFFWCLRIHCQICCHEDLPKYFLLNSFIVLALILNILVYFGWTIIYGVRQKVQHDFLSISLSYCPSTVCAERILFPHWIILMLFSKINWPKILRFVLNP